MKSNRLYFLDAVRAFAIMMMLQGHFIDTLLKTEYRSNDYLAFQIWSYFRGITAPMFFTISGLVFTYLLFRAKRTNDENKRIKKGVYRGVLLVIIGYSLRSNVFSWVTGYFDPYFWVVDVLQCIGLSLLFILGCFMLFKNHSYVFSIVLFTLGCISFAVEPYVRNITIEGVPQFLSNYISMSNGSVFTILPWFGFAAFGAFLSTVFFRHEHRHQFKLITIISFIAIGQFLIHFSTQLLYEAYDYFQTPLIKRIADWNYLFRRLGDVLFIFGLFYTFEKYFKQSIIAQIGKKTLSIYVIHFIILYRSFTGYGLKRYLYKSLDPWVAVLGAIGFVIVVCFIAFHYAKTNTFFYKLTRKIGGKSHE